jgi:TolA-binding protein
MSRNRIFLALFIIPFVVIGQDINEAIRLFNAYQFEQAREIFAEVARDENNPRIAEAYYYLGRLAAVPDSSLFYYRKVMNSYPQSRYADISYLESAKIHIARKNYDNAIVMLNELMRKYPETGVKDEVLFWLGVSYISTEREKEGTAALRDLQKTYPTSVWSERAKDILPAGEKPSPAKEYYTVQVGSYGSKVNAEKYAAQLREKGYEVQVAEALVKGTTYYRVWVGRFNTIEEAKSFSKTLDSLGIKGIVVKGY